LRFCFLEREKKKKREKKIKTGIKSGEKRKKKRGVCTTIGEGQSLFLVQKKAAFDAPKA
jgi:hypothetical protein